MRFYTDGSRIKAGKFVSMDDYYAGIGVILGWGAGYLDYNQVWHKIVQSNRLGGSNINAEMFAIRDLLQRLANNPEKLSKIMEVNADRKDRTIQIVTDSKTSIQIIEICLKLTDEEYYEGKEFQDLKMNEQTALNIKEAIKRLEMIGYSVTFKHVRGHGKDPNMDPIDIEGNQCADDTATEAADILLQEYCSGDKDIYDDIEWYRKNRFRLGFVK